MKRYFTKSFKIQAVEKALSKPDNITIEEIAKSLGISSSSLNRWKLQAKRHELEIILPSEVNKMNKDKRPQDWSLEERLNMIISCGALSEEKLNEYCREQGIYPHHITQWKLDFSRGNELTSKADSRHELKTLKHENKALKKELNRKDRALAETAALLVLQKKVHEIWANDEDNSL